MAGKNPWHQCWDWNQSVTEESPSPALPRSSEPLCSYCGREIRDCPKIIIEHLNIHCHEYCFRVSPSALCCGEPQGSPCKFHPQAFRVVCMGCAKSLPHIRTETVRQSQVSPEGFQVFEYILEQGEFFINGSTLRTPSCPCPTVLGADLLLCGLCALVEVAESSNPTGFPRKVSGDVGRLGGGGMVSVGGRGLQGHLAVVGKCSLKGHILTP